MLGPGHFSLTLSDNANSSPAPIIARPNPGAMLGSRRNNSHQLADPQSLTSTAVPTEQMIRGRPPSELNAELALSISDLFRARLQLSLSFSLGSPNTCRHRASREASCSNCRT